MRQMLEQIVAKLGLPPLILGLSWSTTERMSQQQSEILASELESYRALLTPVILRICRYHLEQTGLGGKVQVKWKHISIADEVEQAKAKLLDMQAKEIEADPFHRYSHCGGNRLSCSVFRNNTLKYPGS